MGREQDSLQTPGGNLHKVFRQLPLFDNPYLNMQAMNIGITDVFLRKLEKNLWDQYIREERTPLEETIFLSALSQMWVFALYELLRTWRQHVSKVIEYGERLANADGDEKSKVIDEQEAWLARAAQHTFDDGTFRRRGFEQVRNNPDVVARLRTAKDIIDPVFRIIELVRITLAKHEIPKIKGAIAEAPGYGRIGTSTGSITWMIVDKEQYSHMISRQDLSNACLEIETIA